MATLRHPVFSHDRRPNADKSNSRVDKIKTWMVVDPLSFNRLRRFYLCHDSDADTPPLKPQEELESYEITYHPGIGTQPAEQQRELQAFEEWVRTIFLRNVPHEAGILQVDLGRDEARTKKPFYEDFYGVELVQWTRKLPYVDHPRRMERDKPGPESGRENVQIESFFPIVPEWDAERDGWENQRMGRYFVKMPDYCFIGDNLEQEQRTPWDAFGECSDATFNTSMQRVEGAMYINFRCADRPNHDFQHWRAYLYELKPMRPYGRPGDKKKRKRHPLTEDETKYEHRAKRRWSTYQRDNSSQAPEARVRSALPDQVAKVDYTRSDSTVSEVSSDDEERQEGESFEELQEINVTM